MELNEIEHKGGALLQGNESFYEKKVMQTDKLCRRRTWKRQSLDNQEERLPHKPILELRFQLQQTEVCP